MNENASGSGRSDDPWLTLGEIAEELRVNPATVRLWVSKGQLAATRAGMRKWLVRRSELDRMLASGNSSARTVAEPATRAPTGSTDSAPEVPTAAPSNDGRHERAVQLAELSSRNLRAAVTASNHAPPSARYRDRLRAIADGLEHSASTTFHAAENSMKWAGGAGWGPDLLSYEVRRGGNRPVREGLWDRFDAAFEALITAGEGTDIRAVAQAFRDTADALFQVVNQLGDEDTRPADHASFNPSSHGRGRDRAS